MQKRIEKEAAGVIERFKLMLDEPQISAVGEAHFEELETLIAAAIGAMISEEAHKAAKMVEEVAHELRKEASLVGE